MTATPTARLHPAIGMLCRDGKTVYYAYLAIAADQLFTDGYVEGTVDELTSYLATEGRVGLRPTPPLDTNR